MARYKLTIFFFLFWLLSGVLSIAWGQTETPFYGSSLAVLKDTLMQDSAGVYYHYRHDSFNTVFLSHFRPGQKEPIIYRLYDARGRMRVWGELSPVFLKGADLVKHGKWVEFHPNGLVRSLGFYVDDEPVDYWEFFHANGLREKAYNLRQLEYDSRQYIMPLGPYEEYFSNGQLHMAGRFVAVLKPMKERVYVPESDKFVERVVERPVPRKAGKWIFFDRTGVTTEERVYDPNSDE